MEEEQLLVINRNEFENLMRTRDRYELFVDALLRSSRLSYDGQSLAFDTGVVDLLVKTFESGSYERLLKQLKDEQDVVLKQILTEKEN